MLASASYDNTIKLIKECDGEWLVFATLTGHTSTVWSLSWDRSGRRIVSGSDDKTIRIWQRFDVNNKEGIFQVSVKLFVLGNYLYQRTVLENPHAKEDSICVYWVYLKVDSLLLVHFQIVLPSNYCSIIVSEYPIGLFKKTSLLKSDAANGFSRCIPQKMTLTNFHKKILMFRGCATLFWFMTS